MVDMEEEIEIDSRLPYRIGCPKLPVLPVDTIGHSQGMGTYFPSFGHHMSITRGILAKHNIPDCGILFAHRVNDGIAAANDNLTLVLVSQYKNGCQDQWVKAVREIRSSLLQSGIHWAIELIDERVLSRRLYTSPILSTDRDLIEGWSRVLSVFLATIKNHDWAAIDVLHQEFPSRGMLPTVIISAKDANDDCWWNSTLPALHQLLQANDLEVGIMLRFSKGVDLITNGSTSPEDHVKPEPSTRAHLTISDDFYQDTLYIGTSCTTSGFRLSGTLGGRIKLQKDSTILELGLTNYHVLQDAFMTSEPVCGPFPPSAREPYSLVVSPSDKDHETVVKGLAENVDAVQTQYDEFYQRVESLAEEDPNRELKTQRLASLNDVRLFLKGRLDLANTYPRHVGHAYAASGYRIRENPSYGLEQRKNWALDWCLIQVDQPRFISSRLYKVPSTGYYIQNKAEVAQYCTISADMHYEVVKRGRTSGWTRGTVSAIHSVVRVTGKFQPSLALPTVQGVKIKGKWGDGIVFVHGIVGTKEDPQFVKPGDSGSLILLDQSSNIHGVSIVGLGFAGNDCSCASYMLPMDLVVKDIEEVTGGKVIEPRYAGQASVIGN
jgi:hypothetical protein